MQLASVKRIQQLEDLIAEAVSIKNLSKFEDAAPAGVSPGVSAQVPGTIGGMGPIVPPTPTSIGSGDNFNPPKRAKNKKDKRILEFADFVKDLNKK